MAEQLHCFRCGRAGHRSSQCRVPVVGAWARPPVMGPSLNPSATGRNERENGLLRGAPKGVVW